MVVTSKKIISGMNIRYVSKLYEVVNIGYVQELSVKV